MWSFATQVWLKGAAPVLVTVVSVLVCAIVRVQVHFLVEPEPVQLLVPSDVEFVAVLDVVVGPLSPV